jgi:phosphoglucomutase/phosphomannomutase
MSSVLSDEQQTALQRVAQAEADGALTHSAVINLSKWLTEPPYADYRSALFQRIADRRFEELDADFWETVNFGTGGRRGRMSDFGSATINERTIAESAHGLASYWKQHSGRTEGRAVVSHDTRLRSVEFAELTATTLVAHGFQVFCFDSHRSTPELSFAVRHLRCDIGVMISASHNPPSDNGFKAYWNSGGQVLAPHDRGIIECVYAAGEIPTSDYATAMSQGQIELVDADLDRAYLDAVLNLSLSNSRHIPTIYTPLHGVGETSVYAVLMAAGFGELEILESQRQPDGHFTNVPDQLPNPERADVFAPAIERAQQTGAELLLASDPDADRLAATVRTHNGQFMHLNGNRVGALLADYILDKRTQANDLTSDHYVVQTLVTTPLVSQIAQSYQVDVVQDLLVGFKFIGEVIDQRGPDLFVFGTEESLGYLAGQYCRDKDAAIAALYLMELASELRANGQTLVDRLDQLFVQHGYFEERQTSRVCTGSNGRQQIDNLMCNFRKATPRELGNVRFEIMRDYGQGERRSLSENSVLASIDRPQGDLLFLESVADDIQVTFAARPSGTEPKIKFYFFGQGRCPSAEILPQVKTNVSGTLDAVIEDLTNWIGSHLE